jgi:hypothetical protein|tara:strand:- start:163 stop:447 length:285 start_codon:yes stop_codon:yes gene_type:complete
VYSQKEEYKEYISQTSLFLRRINIVYKSYKAKEAYRGGYGKKWGKVVQSGMLRRFKVSIGKTRKLGKFNNFRREGENGVSLIHAGFQPVNLHNN